MQSNRAKRNLIATLVGAGIIIPAALYNASNNQGVFFVWNSLQKNEAYEEKAKSAEPQRLADLEGYWQFAIGDQPEWSELEFDDSEWATIGVPGYWEHQGFSDYDGFAWYRHEVNLSEKDLLRPLYVSLGTIDDADEAYFNGVKIGGGGGLPPTYESAWSLKREYPIPENLARIGKNVIAVRVYDPQEGGGIVGKDHAVYASHLPRPLLELQGEWAFRTDETEDYQIVQVPQYWEPQGFNDYNGMGYYKKSFGALKVSAEDELVLYLGKIDDTDEVKLNGQLIGRTGSLTFADKTTDPHYYRIERQYEFPASLLREDNVLEVRVYDHGGDGGIYEGPVMIAKKVEQ